MDAKVGSFRHRILSLDHFHIPRTSDRFFERVGWLPVLVVAVALDVLVNHMISEVLLDDARARNTALSNTIANTVSTEIARVLSLGQPTQRDSAPREKAVGALRRGLETRVSTSAVPVVDIQVYSEDGVGLFSRVAAKFDTEVRSNPGFEEAMQGTVTSRIIAAEGCEPASAGGLCQLLVTRVPLRTDGQSPAVGVLALSTDLTPLMHRFESLQNWLRGAVVVAFLVLYASLVWVARRGEVSLRGTQGPDTVNPGPSNCLLASQEEERHRIAHELHDSVGQLLCAIKYTVEDAMTMVSSGATDALHDRLQRAVDLAREAHEETRRLGTDLHPTMLDDLGLVVAIRAKCDEFAQTYRNIALEQTVTVPESDLEQVLKTDVYRILQEALNNVAAHSQASRVMVSLVRTADSLRLTISDDGVGFSHEEVARSSDPFVGFGLAGMKVRAERVGGTLSIDSTPGQGTIVLMTRRLDAGRRSTG
jgi:signal transduction histidine kinase